MKSMRVWVLLILSGFFAIGLVWQTSRFADLSQKAQDLELEQQNWVAQNTRLKADIAVLSSRERTAEMANYLGLKKIQPEERVRIQIVPEKPGKQISQVQSDAGQGMGGEHD
jgi:cell division protein FtsL